MKNQPLMNYSDSKLEQMFDFSGLDIFAELLNRVDFRHSKGTPLLKKYEVCSTRWTTGSAQY